MDPQQPLNTPQAAPHNTGAVNVVINNTAHPHNTGALHKKWLTALLLSIFLGWLGIDSFYLGQPGKGILKLLTLGLFGILWIIDIIMIATKSVKGIVWIDDKVVPPTQPSAPTPPSAPTATPPAAV